MNNVVYLDELIADRKAQIAAGGIPMSKGGWDLALACIGMAYVYSAWGAECTKGERQKRYNMTGVQNIISACQVLSGKKSSCVNCKWYPDEIRTRVWDCRGFTEWVILEITGFKLYGETCETQWKHADNWCAKGKIGTDPIPQGVLVNLFIYDGSKWKHTGLYFNGSTCECSNGVQHFEVMKTGRWTHWAVCRVFQDEMEADDVPDGYAVVIGKKVAMRQEPSKSAKIIIRINTGEEVKLEPEPEPVWDYVSYKGKKGWMMREFLQE